MTAPSYIQTLLFTTLCCLAWNCGSENKDDSDNGSDSSTNATSDSSTTNDGGSDASSSVFDSGGSIPVPPGECLADRSHPSAPAAPPEVVPCPTGADPATPIKYYAAGQPPSPENGSAATIEKVCFMSQLMNRVVAFVIYLPSSYHNSSDDFPVIYFLHGINGSEFNYWNAYDSDLNASLNYYSLFEQNTVTPHAIFVTPHGGTGDYEDDNSLFFSDQGDYKSESMFMNELIPFIDTNYRTVSSRQGRGIEGFSMGGHGSLRFALKYPGCFATTVSYAAATDSPYAPPDIDEEIYSPSSETVDAIQSLQLGIRIVLGGQDTWDAGCRTGIGEVPDCPYLNAAGISYSLFEAAGVNHNLFNYTQAPSEEAGKSVAQVSAEFHMARFSN